MPCHTYSFPAHWEDNPPFSMSYPCSPTHVCSSVPPFMLFFPTILVAITSLTHIILLANDISCLLYSCWYFYSLPCMVNVSFPVCYHDCHSYSPIVLGSRSSAYNAHAWSLSYELTRFILNGVISEQVLLSVRRKTSLFTKEKKQVISYPSLRVISSIC